MWSIRNARPNPALSILTTRALAAAVLFFSVAARLAATPPNVLLILVDDVGLEHLSFYHLQDEFQDPKYAITETLTELVTTNEEVVLFTDAWSTPVCSSTRMWIQTGLYGFATGVGELVEPSDTFQPDLDEDYFLADLLRAGDNYETAAAFGKWHIGDDSDVAPNLIGYDDFWVTYHKDFDGGQPSYFTFEYTRSTDSPPYYQKVEVPVEAEKYLTRETANAFLAWLGQNPPEPWFAYIAFFASHHPWHCPPDTLYPSIDCDGGDLNLDKHHDMIFALDTEIGRILNAVGGDALFVIAGDNGSQNGVAINPPVDPDKAKSTVAQGGVRVPLLIGGAGVDPDVLGNEVGDIVNLTDLYDTILDFGEADGPSGRTAAEDLHSVSLRPYLADDTQLPEEPLRDCAYTEIFSPNGTIGGPHNPPYGSYELYNIAVRGADYKYMKKYASGQQLLFQLENGGVEVDQWEEDNLLDDQNPPLEEMYLLQECGDSFFEECRLRKGGGEACTVDEECCSEACQAEACLPIS